MIDFDTEEYTNGDVGLEVRTFQYPLRNEYWVKSGITAIRLDEDQFEDLMELMHDYDEEVGVLPFLTRKRLAIECGLVMAIAALVTILILLHGAFNG